ncbi:MAG: carotenoid biosynthesis protein [Verrucomicrobiales bacterium]|nr:carotenoid biosynthesis protein [Verrucomicrobiales bacterium]
MLNYPPGVNRVIRKVVWYAFLIGAAVEFSLASAGYHAVALTGWLDFAFCTLAAAVILSEAAAHVGWRMAALAGVIVVTVSGAVAWLGAPRAGLCYTPAFGPLLANRLPLVLPLLWWALAGGWYLVWHRALPVFDARVVALLVAGALLLTDWLLEPFAARRYYWTWAQGAAPGLNYLGWLALAFILARVVPLRGDSKPDNLYRPLTVTLALAALFLTARF